MSDSNKLGIIAENLDNVLESAYIPELGEPKKGKVRDIYFSGDNVIMIASDRISAFDEVLSRCIPFKGAVLNGISGYAMNRFNIPTAMKDVPHPNVIVQRRLQNIGIECIVRGYVWGSMAKDYENGKRDICGIELPDDLLRYQKLDEPLFTPTTKAEKGRHDENITFEQMAEILGKERAEGVRRFSSDLFKNFSEYAASKDLILIDTKYEFGAADEQGTLYLIDEATTPDSSRFCAIDEWNEKFPKIAEEMKTGKYKSVSKLLEEKPELKIKEESKQFVRDILLEAGYEEGKPIPDLTDNQVIEASFRYVRVYEAFTGKAFDFESALNARETMVDSLAKAGYIRGGCIAFMLASESDKPHAEKLVAAAKEHGVAFMEPFYGSAHKETRKVLAHHDKLNQSLEPVVVITSAGRSDGLGPVSAGNSRFPVIACNPYKDISTYAVDVHSSLRAPSKLPLAVIADPGNAVLYAKRILDLKR
jgi:phosphoribosylaminoimidazole-succinocarboxamide synthase